MLIFMDLKGFDQIHTLIFILYHTFVTLISPRHLNMPY